jgi:signal transduction histidine kinase
MAIAERIVQAHGGQIAVGKSSGSGAQIVVTLPRE